MNKKRLVVDGRLVGLSLGTSFSPDHMYGIHDMRDAFDVPRTVVEQGVPDEPMFGAAVRQIRHNAAVMIKDGDRHIIGHTRGNPDYLAHLAQLGQVDDFDAYWHMSGFALVTRDAGLAERVWNAFQTLDVMFITGEVSMLGAESGLNMLFVSECPQNLLDDMWESDRQAHMARQQMEESGIRDELASADVCYQMLMPKLHDGQLVFFFQASEPDIHNSGWFSIEELRQLCRGEGPIIKKQKTT